MQGGGGGGVWGRKLKWSLRGHKKVTVLEGEGCVQEKGIFFKRMMRPQISQILTHYLTTVHEYTFFIIRTS